MNNNNFRIPPNSGRPVGSNDGKRRLKKEGKKRRIITVSVLILLIVAIVITVVLIKTRTQSEPKDQVTKKSSSSSVKASEESGKKTPSSDSTAEPGGEMDIEFTDADEAYAQSHKYCVGVNRKKNVVTVYEKDENGKYTKPVKAFLCSCGKTGGSETPAGTFKTSDKVRWLSLVDDTYGQYTTRVDGHIWFHSVPYYDKDPSKLETEEFNKLGQNASLGCIRLAVKDVQWLYDNLDWQTIVIIYDSDNPGPLGKPEGIKIDLNSENKGWDPTDTDENNPWN